MPEVGRFADRNGVERAATARQAAEENDEPLVAHHIPYNAWAHMEQAALAIRRAGSAGRGGGGPPPDRDPPQPRCSTGGADSADRPHPRTSGRPQRPARPRL